MSKLVVGLCGPEGAGKSTAAAALRSHFASVEVIPFARPLKRMLEALGVPPENLYGSPDQKTAAVPLLNNFSARVAMQTLGTEWGRRHIGPDIWVRAWRGEVERSKARVIVADDVRFPNEVDEIRKIGGTVILILRSTEQWRNVPRHASEAFHTLTYDRTLMNDETPDALGARIAGLVREHFYPKAHAQSA